MAFLRTLSNALLCALLFAVLLAVLVIDLNINLTVTPRVILVLTGWLAAAIFIPSLALALGAWSGSNRLFEIVYMLWWYRGAFQHGPGLDFIAQPSLLYAGIGLALLAAAMVGRGVQIQQ